MGCPQNPVKEISSRTPTCPVHKKSLQPNRARENIYKLAARSCAESLKDIKELRGDTACQSGCVTGSTRVPRVRKVSGVWSRCRHSLSGGMGLHKDLKSSVLRLLKAPPKNKTPPGQQDLGLDRAPVSHPLGIDRAWEFLIDKGEYSIGRISANGCVAMDGAHCEDVDGFGRREQPSIASVSGNRAYQFGFQILWGKSRRLAVRNWEFDVVGVVPCADHKEETIFPSKPIEKPGQRTQWPIEQPVANPDGQIDHTNLWGYRRLVALSLEEPADSTMEEINDQTVLGNHLRSWLSPIVRIRTKDRTHVEAACDCTATCVKIAVDDERGHCCPMPTFSRWILTLIAIGIINHQTTCKAPMVLQRKSVKQGHYRFTKGFARRFNGCPIDRSCIFDNDTGHLTGSSEKLDLLALDERCVTSRLLEKRLDGTDGKTREYRVIGNLLDGCFLDHVTPESAYEADHPVSCCSSTSWVIAEPEFDLAWDDLVIVIDAFTPVVQYARFY